MLCPSLNASNLDFRFISILILCVIINSQNLHHKVLFRFISDSLLFLSRFIYQNNTLNCFPSSILLLTDRLSWKSFFLFLFKLQVLSALFYILVIHYFVLIIKHSGFSLKNVILRPKPHPPYLYGFFVLQSVLL